MVMGSYSERADISDLFTRLLVKACYSTIMFGLCDDEMHMHLDGLFTCSSN